MMPVQKIEILLLKLLVSTVICLTAYYDDDVYALLRSEII